MSSINTTQVKANNPEALLAFTTLTTNNLLSCALNTCDRLPPLNEFIHDFYNKKNEFPCAVKLFTLIYLLRLKSKLPVNARGGYDTPYRLFLAAVLTSSKYLSETGTGLTSVTLSYFTHHLYTPKDINRMERSFLGLIRYDLWVSANDIQSFMNSYGDLLQIDINQVNIPEQGTMARCLLPNVTTNSSNNVVIIPHPA
ncbi:hypothetical protein MFLAVUS_003475 [Mucor flavus]|uniref:Cyclin N-terminal domain-containing protein n=1 Tax=Mucor flavus TaxID=439312 RepID=A0ABP9YT68_9FUNG